MDNETISEDAAEPRETEPARRTPDDVTGCVPNKPAELIVLEGYLGDAVHDGFCRLYQDVTFRRWLTIDCNDVIDRFSQEGADKLTSGRSIIWVRRTAMLVLCESLPATSYDSPAPAATSYDDDGAYKWPRP